MGEGFKMLSYCQQCGKYVSGVALDYAPEYIEWSTCEACADKMAQEHYREVLLIEETTRLREETHSTEEYPCE